MGKIGYELSGMCRFLLWEIEAGHSRVTEPPLPSAIVSIGPAFHHAALPLEVGMLLPSADTNLALLSAADTGPERIAGLAVGLFLSDPFLNVELAIRRLHASGTRWIAALPSACQHEPEFRQYLREVDVDLDRELRVMTAFSDAGISTIATVSSLADAAEAGSVPSALLLLPHVGGFVDGFPRLSARRDLERTVESEARRAGAPLRIGLRQSHETAETAGLDAMVLRPRRFGD